MPLFVPCGTAGSAPQERRGMAAGGIPIAPPAWTPLQDHRLMPFGEIALFVNDNKFEVFFLERVFQEIFNGSGFGRDCGISPLGEHLS